MSGVVYVETTIFSFYYDERPTPGIVAMRQWTREWWGKHRHKDTLVTSSAVLEELARGQLSHKAKSLAMARTVSTLQMEEAIAEVADAYMRHKVMPADPKGDPLHLAFASYHKLDCLLTWNCRHLANANKFAHIHRINTLLGLPTPALITPLELMGKGVTL
jgi:hypothetical protein